MTKPHHIIKELSRGPLPLAAQEQPISPEMAKNIVLDPHLSLFNDAIAISRGVTFDAAIGLGVIMDITTGGTAIADSSLQAYANYQFIKEAENNFEEQINKMNWLGLKQYRKQNNKEQTAIDLDKACTPEELMAYCKKQLNDKITLDTLKAGSIATTSLAATIFSIGLLFPPAFILTSLLTIVTVGAGVLFTSLGAALNRRVLNNKLTKLLKQDSLISQIDDKLKSLNNSKPRQDDLHHHQSLQTLEKDKKLSKASDALLGSTLVLRISVLARFAVNIIGAVAASLLAVAQFFRGAVDAVINYRNRQKHLANLPKLIAESALPPIDGRRFIFFGETPLEQYIRTHKKQLFKRHHLPAEFKNLSARNLISKLNNNKSRTQLLELRKEATAFLVGKDLKKMCKRKNMIYSPDNQEMMKAYLEDRLEAKLKSDILVSGRINSIKVALGAWVGGSLLFPPLAPIFSAIGVGIMIIGEIVSRFVCRSELKKFKKVTDPLIKQAFLGNPDGDPAVAQVTNFVKTVQAEIGKLPAHHRTTVKILSGIHRASPSAAKPQVSPKFKLIHKELERLGPMKSMPLFEPQTPLIPTANHNTQRTQHKKKK